MITKVFLFSIAVLMQYTTFAQKTSADSLEYMLQNHTTPDTFRVNLLNEAAYTLYTSDLDKTLLYATEAQSLSKTLDYQKGEAESIRLMGIYYEEKSDFSKALECYQTALQIFTQEDDIIGIANSHNNKGIIFRFLGDSPRSMENFQKALLIYEGANDKIGMANSYNNIGIIFHDQSDYTKALEYYLKSFRIAEELSDKAGMANSYINIGIIYHEEKNYPKALEYYQKALKIAEELGDRSGVILNFINTGLMHLLMGEHFMAEKYFSNGLRLSIEVGSKSLKAWNYYGLGSTSLKLNKIEAAYSYSKKAFTLASEIGEVEIIKESAEILSKSCAALERYKEAYEYHIIFKAMSDSIQNEQNSRKTIGLEYEYKYERDKELARVEQEKKEAIHKEEFKRQKTIRNSLIIGFVSVFIVLALVLYNFVQKRRSNRLLTIRKHQIEEKNEELTQLNEEIRAQNENLEQVFTEIITQKEMIEKSHLQITESINYAKLIQNAVLPSHEMVSMLLPEHFILYKPCKIVSGDFYFIKQVKHLTLIVAADCTGHGVPGAFMSMLGIAFLNEIVQHTEIQSSAQVLTELRNKIKLSLQQSGEKGEQRDGMDIAFCALNLETMEMSFAGAHNPCWIFRDSKSNRKQHIVIKADRTPVGVSANEKPFTNHTIQLQKGDSLYLFTDGYHTQFGGEKNEKYQAKRLQDALAQIQDKDMQMQGRILAKNFINWKGKNPQTDDVLVIGIKLH